MKLWKLNRSPWLLLGLASVMMIGCLVMAIGPAQARYQVDNEGTVELEARPLEKIYLGQMVSESESGETRVFDHESQGRWQMVDGVTQLEFAVANGKIVKAMDLQTGKVSGTTYYAQEDQRVLIQLWTDLSVWDGKSKFEVILKIPSDSETEEPREFIANAARISPDSVLYRTFGDGWIFTFQDEEKQELFWNLEGGKLSVLEMTLVLEGVIPEQTGQIKLQITGDYVKK